MRKEDSPLEQTRGGEAGELGIWNYSPVGSPQGCDETKEIKSAGLSTTPPASVEKVWAWREPVQGEAFPQKCEFREG